MKKKKKKMVKGKCNLSKPQLLALTKVFQRTSCIVKKDHKKFIQ